MNDDQRRGLIEGLRLTREAIDKRLDELERRLERGDDVLGERLRPWVPPTEEEIAKAVGEARIRREELRAIKEKAQKEMQETGRKHREAMWVSGHGWIKAKDQAAQAREGGIRRKAPGSPMPVMQTIDGTVAIDRWSREDEVPRMKFGQKRERLRDDDWPPDGEGQ